jgi:Flp pilus assembly protein TadD
MADRSVNKATYRKGVSSILSGAALITLSVCIVCNASAGKRQICDVEADYVLGVEDYAEAIRLHAEVLRKHPENALAHYHLGFAEGMIGNRKAEVREYQRAAALGLRNWDLFLNLGLAQLEHSEVDAATDSLRRAVSLGKSHSEAHFNLALAYDRRGLLVDAEREMLTALRLSPGQPEARNSLGVIYAEEGKTVAASLIWRDLVRQVPNYEPARTNLALLESLKKGVVGEAAAAAFPPAAAVKAMEGQRMSHFPTPGTELVPMPTE